MRKAYIKPTMDNQFFTANEFVSTCYKADCTGYNVTGGVGFIPAIEQCEIDDAIIRGSNIEDAISNSNLGIHKGNSEHRASILNGGQNDEYVLESNQNYYHHHSPWGRDVGYYVSISPDSTARS